MKLKFVLYLIPVALIFGCKRSGDAIVYHAPQFAVTDSVEVSVVNDSLLFDGIYGIYDADSLIIIQSKIAGSDFLFHFIDKSSGDYRGGFARNGRAAGELSTCLCYTFNDENAILRVVDAAKIVDYDVQKILLGRSDCIEEFRPSYLAAGLLHYKGERYLSVGRFADRYVIFEGGDTLLRYDQRPAMDALSAENPKICKMYYGSYARTAFNPRRTKLVSATGCGMIMEILSVSDTRIKSDGVYYFYKPEYEDKGNFILRSRSTPIGCISLAASERYIYALVGEQYSSRDSQMLCIFDWKGRAVRRILFDCDVLGIALSDDAAGLYCWAERDGRPFLGKLEL